MSLNPIVYLQLAILGVVFLGAALFVFALARRARGGGAPMAETPAARAALLASVSVAGSEGGERLPQSFRFSSVQAPQPGERVDDGAVLNLHTQIDALLLERIAEFLQRQVGSQSAAEPVAEEREPEGCVIVVADALPPGVAAESGAPYLNGTGAALCVARALAETSGHAFRTLLIDTGSPAWSIYGVDTADDQTRNASGTAEAKSNDEEPLRPHTAPDVIPLPEDVRGVYDVIAGRLTLDECLLSEDESPLLLALAPGEMPLRWAELLRSAGMRRLLAAARAVAEVVLVYAPRVAEYPEQTRQLAEWSDGVIVIGAEMGRGVSRIQQDQRRALLEFELAATRVLEPESQNSDQLSPASPTVMLAPILGRIALDFTSVPQNATPAQIIEDSSAE